MQVVRGALQVALPFDYDIILFPLLEIGGHPARTEHGLQRPADGRHRHPELSCPVIVDTDLDLGLGLFVIPVKSAQTGVVCFDFSHQNIAPLRQLLVGAPSYNELHRLLDRGAETLAHNRKSPDSGEVSELGAHLVHDLPGRAPLSPLLEHGDDDAGVEVFNVAETARRAHQQTGDLAIVHERHQAGLDFIHVFAHVLVSGSLRPVDDDEEGTAVFLGGIFGRDLAEQPVSHPEKRDKNDGDQQRPAQGASQYSPVSSSNPAVKAVDAGRSGAVAALWLKQD